MSKLAKTTIYFSAEITEQAQKVKEKLIEEGKHNVTLGDIFEATFREAIKKQQKIIINKPWTFEQAITKLRESESTSLKEPMMKETLKSLWSFFESRAAETEAALSDGIKICRKEQRGLRQSRGKNTSKTAEVDGEGSFASGVAEAISKPSALGDSKAI